MACASLPETPDSHDESRLNRPLLTFCQMCACALHVHGRPPHLVASPEEKALRRPDPMSTLSGMLVPAVVPARVVMHKLTGSMPHHQPLSLCAMAQRSC